MDVDAVRKFGRRSHTMIMIQTLDHDTRDVLAIISRSVIRSSSEVTLSL